MKWVASWMTSWTVESGGELSASAAREELGEESTQDCASCTSAQLIISEAICI